MHKSDNLKCIAIYPKDAPKKELYTYSQTSQKWNRSGQGSFPFL